MKKILEILFGGKCQCGNNTHQKNEEGEYECIPCKSKKGLQKRIAAEESYACPVDGEIMMKNVLFGAIVNKCPKCHGIWISSEDAKHLNEIYIQRRLAVD